MPTPDLHHTAAKGATMLAFHCVRNSYLEDLHAGIFPSSQTGDYTDVKVVSPSGEIAWNRLGRISDEEMQRLSADIVNRLYTFLFYLLSSGEPDRGIPLPKHLSLCRLNHWLPRTQAHPEVVERTAQFHHEVTDALLPEAVPIFHDATALDTAIDVLNP